MKTAPGDYIGRIVEHGTEERGGKPLVWFSIGLCGKRDEKGGVEPYDQEDLVFCRFYLEGGTEEKTATAVRMARAGLKLCGFDPDARELEDLDFNPRLLAGNEVPVRVSEREWNGQFFTNYDISVPRSTVGSTRAKSITSALRAAKSKDEPPVAAQAPRTEGASPPPMDASKMTAQQRAALERDAFAGEGDIPFVWLVPLLTAALGVIA